MVLSARRTPIGAFNGGLSSFNAVQLGAIAVKDALAKSGVDPSKDVGEVYLGNVVSANSKQAPARQVLHYSGLPWSTIATTINKVCASGMKATMLGASSIMLGTNVRITRSLAHSLTRSLARSVSCCVLIPTNQPTNQLLCVVSGVQNVVVTGGFESMSNIPYYLPKVRQGLTYGHGQVLDGVRVDGLDDAYDGQPMGNCAEVCAETYKLTRQDQDAYALESYRRAQEATKVCRD